MAFVERGWRSFLRTGDPDPTAWRGRMAGQLMTYEACTDPRAWCLSAADRRQHLVDIMRRGPEDLDGMLPLPTETVVRREQPVEKKRPEVKLPAPPKTPPVKEEVTPKDVGVPRVEFTEEEKPTIPEEQTPPTEDKVEEVVPETPEVEPEVPEIPEKKSKPDKAGDFCENLSGLANELEGMLDDKSVRTHVPRLYEICTELSRLAIECEAMQAEMTDRQSQAHVMLEAARAAADNDLQEDLLADYDSFDSTRFQMDIAQVRLLEEKLNAMRIDSMEDDAEETDETWELRNLVAQLENRLEYSQDEDRMPGRAEDYSQTDYVSATAAEPSEGSVSTEGESVYSHSDKRSQEGKESDELKAIIENLQRRIEILEAERQDRGRDMYEESREAANLKEQLQNLSAERDNLLNQLNSAKAEAEALQQEKASLLLEADAIRQEMGQLQGEHLAALDYIKSLEESTAECTMLKEENKRFEDKLQQSTRDQAKLHHEVHKLQCIIRDVEDDRKRTLNQLERLSYAAEWAKEAHQSLLEKEDRIETQEQEITYLLNTIDDISSEMDRCKDIQQTLDEKNGELLAQEEEIFHLTKHIEELSVELENCKDANKALEDKEKELRSLQETIEMLSAERDRYKDIAEQAEKTAESLQSDTMSVSDELLALQQQIISLTEALAKEKEESDKLQAQLNALRSSMSVAEIAKLEDVHKSVSAISVSSLTSSAMRNMLVQARSALSVVMMELEDSAKNMEILAHKNKVLMEENELLKQELESLQGGVRLTTPDLKFERVKTGSEGSLPKQEEKRRKDEHDFSSDKHSEKRKGDEDFDHLQDQLKACKAENEELLTVISKQNAEIIEQKNLISQLSELRSHDLEGKSMESVKEEALLLQNQLQAERLRHQKTRDSLHKMQVHTESVMKEAALAAVSDDRLKRMGEVHLLENQYKAQKLVNEKLWKLIASLKSDTEKLKTVLPDNISEVSATICENDIVSEEMKNVCNQLIAAKEENKRLQEIMDNLRRGIDILQSKLTETNIEDDTVIMQTQGSSSAFPSQNPENDQKLQAYDVTNRLSKLVTGYPEQSKEMPDTESIRELTKEVRCLHEKLVVNVTACTIEAMKEENLRLENLLKLRDSEIATLRGHISEEVRKGTIQMPESLQKFLDEETLQTGVDESIVSSGEERGAKKLLTHLEAENELLRKHLERRTTHTSEIMSQLQEENELLKKQLSSETQIIDRFPKESIKYVEKPVVVIKEPQERAIDAAGITDIKEQRRGTVMLLRDQIGSLKEQLNNANNMVKSLEMAVDELRDEKESLEIKGITEEAQQACAKSTAEAENERILRNRIESLQKQLTEANNIAKNLPRATLTEETERERSLINQIESLQSQLNDANNMLTSLQRTLDEMQTEKESLQDRGISEVTRQSCGKSAVQAENEQILRNENESLRKQLSDANNKISSLETTLDKLRTEKESLQDTYVTDVTGESRGKSAAQTENEMILRNRIESLQRRLTEANNIVSSVPRSTSAAETENERILRNQVESLQNQLSDANDMIINLLAEVKTEKEVSQDAAVTEVARRSRVVSAAQTEQESILRNQIEKLQNQVESLQKQLSEANNEIRSLQNTIDELRNENKSLKDKGVTSVVQEIRGESTAETDNESILRKQIEVLQSQLSDANSMVGNLEKTVDELRNRNKLLQDTGVTQGAQQIPETSVAGRDSEMTSTNQNDYLQKQLNDANNRINSLESTVSKQRDEIQLLKNKLNDSNTMLQKLEDENNVLKSTSSKDIPAATIKKTIPQDLGAQAPSSVDPEIQIVMEQLKTENESLRRELETARKPVHQKSGEESEYQKVIAELKTENELLHKKIEDARLKQPKMSHEDPGTTKIINQMTQENELLRKQIEDLKKTQARPSSVETGPDKAFEQLLKDNEALRKNLENTRVNIQATGVIDESAESKDVVQLRLDNELLRKQLEDARKMAQMSQEQIVVADYTTVIDQLREENEFLKKRLESLTDIPSISAKEEVVKYVEKPVEVMKADIDSEKTINELRNLNESLQNQLKEANTIRKDLEEQVSKLKDEKQVPVLQSDEKTSEEDISQIVKENELLKKQLLDATSTIEDLTMNVTKLKDEIQNLQSTQISDLPPAKEEFTQDLQKLEAELQTLRDENRHLKRDNEKLTLEIEGLKEEQTPSEVALWKTEERQLESVVGEQKERIENLLSKMGRKDQAGEVAAWTKEREHLLDQIRQLTKEAKEAKEAYEEKEAMDDRMNSLLLQMEAMKQKLADQEREAEAGGPDVQNLQEENDKMKNQVESLNSELEAMQQRLKEQEAGLSRLTELQEENSRLLNELDSLKAELERLQAAGQAAEQLQSLLEENQKLKEENERLQKELDSLKESMEKLKSAEETAAQAQTALEDNQRLNDENGKLKGDNERLQKDLDSLKEELEKLRSLQQSAEESQSLKDENDRLLKELEKLQSAQQAAEANQAENQSLKDDKERLQKELDALREQMEKLQAAAPDESALEENQKLKDDNERLQKELEALKAEMDALKQKAGAEDLQDELNKLKAENEKLKNELEALKAEMDALKQKAGAEDLQDELNKLKAENEKLKNELQSEKEKLENELKQYLEKNKSLEDQLKSFEGGDDAAKKALQDELDALKAENKKLQETGASESALREQMEADCEAKLAALRSEHQKELERREQAHRENLETCQLELNELKGKLQESDKTLQLNLDKGKNKDEDAKEIEGEIARLEKEKEMITKNLKADLEKKTAELDKQKFENAELKKQLEKCLGDCEDCQKELNLLKEKLKGVSSGKSAVLVEKSKSEPVAAVKVEKAEEKVEKKPKKEKEKKEKKEKEKKEKKSKVKLDETDTDTDKSAKKPQAVAKKKTEAKPQTTSKSKLEEKEPEDEKKGDRGVCRCMEHPLVKIIYKILHGGTEVLNTEEIIYLHKKLCSECRTALGPPRNEAQVRARARKLRQEIMEQEEKVSKGVADLEESLLEGKVFLARLREHFVEKQKATQEAIERRKKASTYQQMCSASMTSGPRRTASGTAIGGKNQQWRGHPNKSLDPTAASKIIVRCPG